MVATHPSSGRLDETLVDDFRQLVAVYLSDFLRGLRRIGPCLVLDELALCVGLQDDAHGF